MARILRKFQKCNFRGGYYNLVFRRDNLCRLFFTTFVGRTDICLKINGLSFLFVTLPRGFFEKNGWSLLFVTLPGDFFAKNGWSFLFVTLSGAFFVSNLSNFLFTGVELESFWTYGCP